MPGDSGRPSVGSARPGRREYDNWSLGLQSGSGRISATPRRPVEKDLRGLADLVLRCTRSRPDSEARRWSGSRIGASGQLCRLSGTRADDGGIGCGGPDAEPGEMCPVPAARFTIKRGLVPETPSGDWSGRRRTSAPTVPRARPSAWWLGGTLTGRHAEQKEGCAACNQPQGNRHRCGASIDVRGGGRRWSDRSDPPLRQLREDLRPAYDDEDA
jgi:hypothetical protein